MRAEYRPDRASQSGGVAHAASRESVQMVVVLNSGAGAAAEQGSDRCELVKTLFREASGTEPRVLQPDATRGICDVAREAAGSDASIIVAAGGDGTISAVATAIASTGKTLGVLPFGTLNHFAKDLGISLVPAEAVRTIVEGQTAEIDAGEVNGHLFINNSSLGLYPRIVAYREAQQQRRARTKWVAFAWAALYAFRRFPFLDLRIEVDGRTLERRTPFLFIGNNPYEISGFNLGERKQLNSGRLGIYLAKGTGRLGLCRLAANALLGRLRQASDFENFPVQQACIESRKRRILVACDGEVLTMETPLAYQIRPRLLRVLVPTTEPV